MRRICLKVTALRLLTSCSILSNVRMVRMVNAFVLVITWFIGVATALATIEELSLPRNTLHSRVLYSGRTGNMRYFLNSLDAIIPNSIGIASYSVYALYHHALTLLQLSRETNSLDSTFGFSLGHLDLTLATTNDSPIPWNTALEFSNKMYEAAERGLLAVEYQALVFDLALDVTIQVTLKLLFDSPL